MIGKKRRQQSEYVTCPTCGMGWPTRALCPQCAFRSSGADPACTICHGTGEAGLTPAHTCPEPYPYKVALSMVQMAESMALRGSLMIVSPTQKARIKLGLEQGET